ncbi:ATP-binding protein [Kitasatospora sp. NPDC059571]|uniref:ATP-binding protein n=1 Tax=Kitasatospora sp. NPDC059571 TaxID=3346871 RepID=UPI0036AA2E15
MTTEERVGRRTVRVPHAAGAPRAARALLRRTVGEVLGGVAPAGLADAELALSELVTNAVRHGGPPIGLRLAVSPEWISIEVRDGGRGRPVVREPDPDAVSGRGLAIVRAVADEWGVRRDGSGTVVHAVLPLRRTPAAA